jgi:amidohydrolase
MKRKLGLVLGGMALTLLLSCGGQATSNTSTTPPAYNPNASLAIAHLGDVGDLEMLNEIMAQANDLQETIIKHQRFLHQTAEVGDHLPITTAYVKKALEDMGYEVNEIIDSGLVTLVGGKRPGKTMLLRADMDALPIREESGLPWAATNGNMHACGHDFHTAMLLGVAQILKDREDSIPGTIKLMFQPNEEGGRGAINMIRAGVLQNPKVDAAMGTHIVSQGSPTYFGGETKYILGVSSGYAMASIAIFNVNVQGVGTHGAMPNLGVDPIVIGANIVQAWQTILAREIPASEPVVLTFGSFNAGNAPNIVPNNAQLTGTLRAFTPATEAFVIRRMSETAEGIAKAYRGTATVTINEDPMPSLYGDPIMAQSNLILANQVTGGRALTLPAKLIMASEDFSHVSHLVPTNFFALFAPLPDANGNIWPQHHPKVQFDPAVVPYGVTNLAYSALQWLENNP